MFFTSLGNPDLHQGQTAACLNPVTRAAARNTKRPATHQCHQVGSKLSPDINEKWYQNNRGTKNEQEMWVALHKPTTRRMRKTNQATGHKDKALSTFQLGSISAYFFCAMKNIIWGDGKNNFHLDIGLFIRLKPLQLSSLCICVIYYLNRSCFTQVRMLCITLDLHICTEPWSFKPWYIFLAAWIKEWIWMNVNE